MKSLSKIMALALVAFALTGIGANAAADDTGFVKLDPARVNCVHIISGRFWILYYSSHSLFSNSRKLYDGLLQENIAEYLYFQCEKAVAQAIDEGKAVYLNPAGEVTVEDGFYVHQTDCKK